MVQSTLSVFKKVLLGVSLLVSLFVVSNSAFAGTGDTKYVCVGQPVSVNWNIANCASPTYIAPSACDPFTPPTAGGAGSSALPYATVDCNLTINACGDSAVASVVVNVPGTWNGSSCQIASPDPTASLKVTAGTYGTNVSTISYPAGTANTKTWSSTNGATYSDRYRLTGSCANNSWNTDTAWKVFGTFTSASGNSNTNAQEGDVGCVRNTDYVVKNGTKSATSSIQETVTRCLDEKYFTAGSGCVACGNSGCTGTGGSVSDPDGSLSCTNGSTIKPACTLNPVIDTPTASNITSTGATLGANFRSAGTKTITERGTCWGSSANPSSNCVAEGSTATGVFSHARGSMLANTTYYYRGFVRDNGGTYYFSADATFTTAAAGGISGTLSASPEACTILNGASTCWSTFTWTTTNATSGVSQVVGDGGGPSSNSVNNGSQSLQARYIPNAQYPNPHTFRLYNNSKELATVNVTADCASGSVWDGDSCEACQNGGCTNHVCNNGSTIKPACTLNPVIDTPTASNITSTGATLGANFRSAGTKTITERGTCWGSSANPSSNCVAEGSTATGVFSHARGSMLANTTYYYRGFVRDNGGTYYFSADATFTTAAAGGISGTLSASPEACTILNGASTCWSTFTWTTTNATSGVSQVVGDGGGPSSNSVNNGSQSLQARYIPNAQYPNPHTFRLYNNSKELATVNVTADCASGSVWDGDSCEACQNGGCTNHVCNNGSTIKPACTLNPVIDTPTASNITSTGATLGANFRSAGTKTITERGTCWGSSANPSSNCVAEGSTATGVFSHARGSMLANTTYYYRGFVRDNGGTYYFSADATFTTAAPADSCGTGNGNIQNPDQQPSGGAACSSGTFTDAADTAAAWNWKCGSLSCSAPKWGCNVSTDTNYDAFGADNAWKCAGTCKNGHANYPTCPGAMSGNLSAPSGTTCTIADDATNCAVTLYWKVTNPESATTQIVRDSDSAVIYSPQHEDTKSVSAFGYLSPSRHSLKNNGVTLKTIDVTGQCNTGRHVHTDNRCRLMSGTLTSSANSCVISSGNSTCNVSLSWSVSYPQNAGGSSVTRIGNVNVKINDDSENNYSVAVPYSGSGITYYLYNNSIELATKVITTSCANGTSWDGDNCAPNAGPTASFTNEPFSCTVSSGNSSCNPTLTWTSANITPVILTDCGNGIYGSYLTGDQSASVFSGYTGGCYRVQYGGVNNAGILVGGTILDTTNTTASCANGTSWDGDSCEPNACANGATNPPTCTICPADRVMDGGSCVVCLNGGCTGGACNNGGANPPVCTPPSCANGATNPPTCDICPADRVMDAGSCVVCDNGGCTGGACNNGGSNPPVCTPPSCANGATNPPTCDICPADRVMDAGSCVVCDNGGCTGGNCNNGSVTKPACTLPTGSLSVAPLSCSIATGDSTCQVRATWSTQDPIGTSQITHNSPNGTIVYTANSGVNQPINLTAAKSTVKIFLYNNGEPPLDSEDVSVACTAGPGKWDSVGGKCVDPEVTGVVKTGEYGFPGFPPNINFICSSANAWKILKNGVLEIDNTVYSGPQDFTPDASATYTIICKHGNVESDPWSVYFDMVPKSPKALLNISPVTIEKGGQTVLTWAIQYPDNTCTLSAKVLCVNNSCSQEQKDYEKGINDILSSPAEETDGNDPNGKRNLRTSLRNFAPGHSPTDNPTDYKALGKKTVRQIRYTTEFTAACQTGTKETKRVNVSTSNEG